jgi:hypothetical protein
MRIAKGTQLQYRSCSNKHTLNSCKSMREALRKIFRVVFRNLAIAALTQLLRGAVPKSKWVAPLMATSSCYNAQVRRMWPMRRPKAFRVQPFLVFQTSAIHVGHLKTGRPPTASYYIITPCGYQVARAA